MRRAIFAGTVLFVLGLQAALADLTISYKLELKPGAGLPAQAVAAMKTALEQNSGFPDSMVMQFKGDRARTAFGPFVSIVDYSKGTTTTINVKNKRYATVPTASSLDHLQAPKPEIPKEAMEVLRNMTVDVQLSDTSKTGLINGMRAEESKLTISVHVPTPSMPVDMLVDISNWRPLEAEMQRIPQLREFAAYTARAKGSMDPAQAMQKIFEQIPALGDKLRSAVDTLMKATGDRPSLKMQMTLSMPGMAKKLDEMRQQGQPVPPEMNFSGPLMEMSFELTELSAKPIDDSVFEVPADFQADTMANVRASQSMAAKATFQREEYKGEIYRAGGGVTSPERIYNREPLYSEAARTAHVEGTVTLFVVVAPDGLAHNIRVTKPLHPDLDQNAIAAVSQWRFRPGEKDGKPVAVAATIEVYFRLLKDAPPTAERAGFTNGPRRLSGGVPYPSLMHKVEPEYTEAARAAGVEGTVVLYVEITPEGTAQNIRVVKSLDPGLDQNAIAAVRKWRFRPGNVDGTPVIDTATLEVNFRLLKDAPQGMNDPLQAAPAQPQARVGSVYRVGNGVTAPRLIYKVEPEFSEAARAAHQDGTVTLYAEVGPDGLAHNIRVIKSLGLGLDEQAIAAVSKWRFRPGEKAGMPVTVAATIEVNFRFLKKGEAPRN